MTSRNVGSKPIPTMSFKAYAVPHNDYVELGTSGGKAVASLIDFSSQGARIKTKGSAPAAAGDTVNFNIRLTKRGLETGAVPCTVTWSSGDEIEVRFPGSPGFTVGEMQTILD